MRLENLREEKAKGRRVKSPACGHPDGERSEGKSSTEESEMEMECGDSQ